MTQFVALTRRSALRVTGMATRCHSVSRIGLVRCVGIPFSEARPASPFVREGLTEAKGNLQCKMCASVVGEVTPKVLWNLGLDDGFLRKLRSSKTPKAE
jgi:hypothetical protein